MVARNDPEELGEPEAASVDAGAHTGLAGVAIAAERVRADLTRFLEARGAGIASSARKLLLTAALYVVLTLVGVVVVSSALVLLLLGSARALALLLGLSEPLGYVLVGGGTLTTFFFLLARRRRAERVPREDVDRGARQDLIASSAILARELATPPGLLAAGILGFGGMKVLRIPALRGFSALVLRASRTLARALQATSASRAPRDGDLSRSRSPTTPA